MKVLIGHQYTQELTQEVNNAKKNIDIVMYEWRLYPNYPESLEQKLNVALLNAVRRGVIVDATVNFTRVVSDLLKHGIKIRQYKSYRTMHTKLVLIDNKTLFIGSHNFTRNAANNNIELSAKLDLEGTEQLERVQYFINNLKI